MSDSLDGTYSGYLFIDNSIVHEEGDLNLGGLCWKLQEVPNI